MPAPNALLQEGRYRINNEFTAAADGSVYEAYDNVSETNVIVKEIPVRISRTSMSSPGEDLNTVFANRVKVLTEISHPSLLGIRDHFSETGRQYLVMESIDGDDLQTLLDRQKSCFPVSDAANWADQLLDALNYLHTDKTPIIHKNIRPSNVNLGSDGNIQLMLSDVAAGDSATASTLGGQSIAYSPLEQIWSGLDPASQKLITSKYDEQSERILKQSLDARSDIYSLGATLYHLVTARLPIDALERSIEILDGRPDPLRAPHKVDAAIAPEISEVVMKALEIKREYRFDSAAIMRQVLKTAIVRVKEREADELLEQEEAANDIKLAAQKKLEANADQLSETVLMKRKLEEAEAQRLLAEQRAADAERKLRESEAIRQSNADRPAAPKPKVDDLLDVLSPSLHASEFSGPKAQTDVPSPIENLESVTKEPSAPMAEELALTEGLTAIVSEDSSIRNRHEPADPDPLVESDWEEETDSINFLPPPREGSLFSVPAIAAGAAVIVLIAIGSWMFVSSRTSAPIKTTTAEAPVPAQSAPQDPAVTSAFQTDATPANEEANPSPADPALTDAVVSDSSAVPTAALPKPKKSAKSPAVKKAVTADDLINDN